MGLTRRLIRRLSLVLLVLAGAALAGCSKQLPQSPFDAQGDVVQMQMDVLKLSLWFAIGIGAVVTLALLFVVFRYRQKGTEKKVPEQVHGSTKLEIAWTLIPIIILAIVAVPTVKTAFATRASKDPNALNVRVVAHQWWFEFEYPDHKVVTANELYIPVGKD
ncbi:MAG TPA: cytochrome c oxidase subunit II, partial [Symbiobacteriaceae bacterium]|nr:cytochrome c oxidase subunit II [Symbiobacteriaceae bacterium]